MPKKDPLAEIVAEATEQLPPVPDATLAAKASAEMSESLKKTQENLVELQNSKLVALSMSPMYAPYFGEVMTVGLNGLNIYFPVDGRTYKVREPYAMIIKKRQRAVDDLIKRQERMANVTANKEQSAGEMVLIPR